MDKLKNMETRDLLIPKVIHYCWLSGDPYPLKIRRCMDTWRRVMPGYRLKLWTTDNFDVASVPYVKEAYEHISVCMRSIRREAFTWIRT